MKRQTASVAFTPRYSFSIAKKLFEGFLAPIFVLRERHYLSRIYVTPDLALQVPQRLPAFRQRDNRGTPRYIRFVPLFDS
jgi:hypothetical protein